MLGRAKATAGVSRSAIGVTSTRGGIALERTRGRRIGRTLAPPAARSAEGPIPIAFTRAFASSAMTFEASCFHRRKSPDALQKFRPSNPSQIVTKLRGEPRSSVRPSCKPSFGCCRAAIGGIARLAGAICRRAGGADRARVCCDRGIPEPVLCGASVRPWRKRSINSASSLEGQPGPRARHDRRHRTKLLMSLKKT